MKIAEIYTDTNRTLLSLSFQVNLHYKLQNHMNKDKILLDYLFLSVPLVSSNIVSEEISVKIQIYIHQ